MLISSTCQLFHFPRIEFYGNYYYNRTKCAHNIIIWMVLIISTLFLTCWFDYRCHSILLLDLSAHRCDSIYFILINTSYESRTVTQIICYSYLLLFDQMELYFYIKCGWILLSKFTPIQTDKTLSRNNPENIWKLNTGGFRGGGR